MNTIPQALPDVIAAFLPWIATLLSSFLHDDRLSARKNALIVLACIVLTAILCVLLAGDFTGNWRSSLFLVLGYVAVIMKGDLGAVYTYFQKQPSPLPTPKVDPPPQPPSTPSQEIPIEDQKTNPALPVVSPTQGPTKAMLLLKAKGEAIDDQTGKRFPLRGMVLLPLKQPG